MSGIGSLPVLAPLAQAAGGWTGLSRSGCKGLKKKLIMNTKYNLQKLSELPKCCQIPPEAVKTLQKLLT